MPNEHLLKVQEQLPELYTYFQDDSILVISEDKEALPFMYLINDDNHKDALLMSIAVDYPTAINVGLIILAAVSVLKVIMIGPFYISQSNGKKYLNDDAQERWDMETLELNDINPLSKYQH